MQFSSGGLPDLQFAFPLTKRLMKAQVAVRTMGKGGEGASHVFHLEA